VRRLTIVGSKRSMIFKYKMKRAKKVPKVGGLLIQQGHVARAYKDKCQIVLAF
jgi:hypothetical protein